MARELTKQEVLDLITHITEVLEKLNACLATKNQVDTYITQTLCSDKFKHKLNSYIAKEFNEGKSLASTEDIILSFKTLFRYLYCKNKYQSIFDECEQISQTYQRRLKLAMKALQDASNFNWMLNTDIIKNNVSIIKSFKNSDLISRINEMYFTLQSDTPCSDEELIRTFDEHYQEWFGIMRHVMKKAAFEPSDALSKVQEAITRFNIISDIQITDDAFETEIEQYRSFVQDIILKETTVEIVTDVISELEKMSVDELNYDKSGIKVSHLKNNGFNTIGDLYRAPVQAIAAIRGISEDTAHEIKHKIADIIELLQSNHQTTTQPFKINYDSPTEHTDNIVTAVYNCRRFLMVQKNIRTMGLLDFQKINQALDIVSRFKYDTDWLFYRPRKRTNIIKAYAYLKKTLEDTRYKNYVWFERYQFKNVQFIQKETAWEDFKNNSVVYFNTIEFLVPDAFEDVNFAYGLPEELAEQIAKQDYSDDGLTCQLRRYQRWGVKYILHQERALLGDEMGLGKTVQAIATMVALKNAGYNHFLVICPSSVLINWFKEVRQHSILQSYIAHGNVNKRNEAVKAWKYYGGVLVTTYDTYSNLEIDNLDNIGIAVIDEAHYIKNPKAARSQRIRALCAQVERVLFLTGTPIENNVTEMLSLIGVLKKDVEDDAAQYAHISTSSQFKIAVAPVYFRRKQCDVNKELPEKIETVAWCSMTNEERDVYDKIALNNSHPFMPMRRVSWQMNDLSKSSKAEMLKGIVEDAIADNRKVIVFSFFRDTIEKVHDLFPGHCTDVINGEVNPAKRQDIIDEFTNNPEMYVLPGQIGACGTGSNIQAASVVVMCEPQIKPSIENQAIARAHRMGQSRNVIVYRLCCEDSIDERMLEILDRKKEQFEVFADESISGDRSLDMNENDEDVKQAISDEIDNIKRRHGILVENDSFKNSEEGQEWHDEQMIESHMQFQKIENRGRARHVGEAQRYRILNRDNFTCQKCGRYGPGAKDENGNPMPEPKDGYAIMEVDHKKPFSLGGSDDDDNLWTLCDKCNGGKSNNYID